MAPLSQEEKDALINKVSQALLETPYACSSLTHLSNGTTNFVFRGKLIQATHEDGGGGNTAPATTVIVKHSLEHAALNKNLLIDTSRALYEESMLDALNDFSSGVAGVKTPRLHLFIRDTNIQVLEDFPDAIDLKSIFVSPTRNIILTKSVAASIGHDIGAWLRSFHDWSMSPNVKLKDIGNNEPMRKLKYAITYDSHLKVLENNFPSLLEGHQSALEQVKDAAMKEFKKVSRYGDEDKNWGLIHGDFWSGNVLLLGNPSPAEAKYPSGAKTFIIDWEFTQFGHRAYDIGQMISDIYERWHFSRADGAIPAIEGFIDGYGGLEDDSLAFRIAIHAGVQLIGWYIRRAPNSPLPFPIEKITDAMRIGRDWVEKGWQKDRYYFESTPMASLFKKTNSSKPPNLMR
ncbi:kinase-like domain-containing protein [Xylaria digitata]|nr:kinase-like domain-containing protein [Xylaria digitata]